MKDITVQPDITIRKAMKKLNQSGEKCLVITNAQKRLLGTLSDGDLRRAILKGATVGDTIESVYQHKPMVLRHKHYDLSEAKKLFTKRKFDIIPVVDEEWKLKDILFWETVFRNGEHREEKCLDTPVVIMSGGRGTRMEPFTKVLPKPLLPVNEKPVIEHIIERFTDVGCREFHLTVNYKGRILKAYFEELQPDYGIHYVDEPEPLGTAGSLKSFRSQFDSPFFVTNCDIIIKADYGSLYEFHSKGDYDITLVDSNSKIKLFDVFDFFLNFHSTLQGTNSAIKAKKNAITKLLKPFATILFNNGLN